MEPESPDLPGQLIDDAVAAGTLAAIATGKPSHHGPLHTHCENCGTKLDGPWCHQCGQHDFEFHRSFRHVFMEVLESVLHFEGKFFRNIVTLLFSPGRLTAEFNAGKRAAQMPPFRLYLFVSLLFFFINFIGSHPGESLDLSPPGSPQQQAAVRRTLDEALHGIAKKTRDPQDRAAAERAIRRLRESNESKPLDLITIGQVIDDEIRREKAAGQVSVTPTAPAAEPPKKILRTNNPGGFNFSVNESNNTALERLLTEKGKYAYYHQQELVEAFVHALPRMLLVCLPFFALFTRVLYRKSGPVYLQHLVVALHFHTFIFLWVLIRNGWVFLAGFLPFGLKSWLAFGCNLWLVLYPVLMLRRLFANSWPKTIVKTGLLAAAYACTLGLGFLATAIILFLLL